MHRLSAYGKILMMLERQLTMCRLREKSIMNLALRLNVESEVENEVNI